MFKLRYSPFLGGPTGAAVADSPPHLLFFLLALSSSPAGTFFPATVVATAVSALLAAASFALAAVTSALALEASCLELVAEALAASADFAADSASLGGGVGLAASFLAASDSASSSAGVLPVAAITDLSSSFLAFSSFFLLVASTFWMEVSFLRASALAAASLVLASASALESLTFWAAAAA